MNFKKIEVFGFKSFADRKKVEFQEGITGIVGPNGCGKSNVADAVRWVLGEQSAKALRGKSMQDVIFNGTARRKPMSYSEVSLYFDNSRKLFANLDYEEVKITRKLFRSGESEYYINDIQCRLMDIQDMIRNTGLGKDGYSIIGQGRVTELIDAKPENRRNIFEDAAGISTHKKRKKEAQSKLERVESNLQRLEDIIAELDRQLEPLERQSADARKFLQLRDELKDLEINEYIYQYENSEELKRKVREVLDGIEEQLSLQRAQYADADKQYSRKMAELSNTDVYMSRLRDELTALAVAAESIKGAGNTLSERMSHLTTSRAQAESRLIALEEELDKKSEELSYYVSQLNMATEEKGDREIEYSVASSEYEELLSRITSGEQEMESRNDELLKAMENIADIKENYGKLTAERDTMLERVAELDEEIERLKEDIVDGEASKSELETNVDRLRTQCNRLLASRNEVMQAMNEASGNAEKYREAVNQLQTRISAVESRLKMLVEYSKDYDSFKSAVKYLMQASRTNTALSDRIEGVVAELVKVPKDYETAIVTALGGSLQNVVTRNEDDTKYIINYMKANRIGSITFLPMTSYKSRDLDPRYRSVLNERGCVGIASELIDYDSKYDSIVSGLLGSTVVFDNIDNAVTVSRKYGYNVRIVTLDGDLINTTGSISGGSKNTSPMANVFSQERTVEEYREAIERMKGEYDIAVRNYRKAQEEFEEYQEQLRAFDEDLREAQISFAAEEQRLDKAVGKCEELNAALILRTAARDSVRRRIDIINSGLSSVDTGVSVPVQDDESERERRAGYTAMKERSRELGAMLSDLRVQITTLDNNIAVYGENISRLNNECQSITSESAAIKTAIATTEGKIKQTESDIDNAVVSDKDRARQTEIKQEISDLDERKKVLSVEMADINAFKEKLTQCMIDGNSEKVRNEARLQKIDEDAEEMRVHILEEYELDYEGALRFRVEAYDHEKGEPEIVRIKRAMNKLGPVNIEAIEMFKQTQERHGELSVQRDDMRKAQQDIVDIINDLSKEMTERFATEFNKINANFKAIFKELFGGGNGKLELDTSLSDDPLEAGVEIFAEPPGKKLQRMSLLSGGEKALTAIAILFAILKLRPMPFCILDEIEAALDDSNVDLFAKYLKRFSDDTQFIVITHRKPTMEQADMLYGVTMQEQGVSDIVSVSLKEAVRHSETK